MKTMIARSPGPLLALAALTLLLSVPCCEGCGEQTAGGKPGGAEAGKAAAARPPRPVKPRRAGTALGTTDEELATITIKAVAGGVTVVPRAGEARRPAQEGDGIRGGGEVAVAADGSATVVIRDVGHISLTPGSILVAPARQACGAVLIEGAGLTAGSARERREQRCYLHTPAGALLYSRAKAVVAVAPGGRTRVAATEGAIRVALPARDPIEIVAGTQLTLDPREGPVGGAEPFVHEGGPVERAFDGWRGSQPRVGEQAVGRTLDEADRLAGLLEGEATRLVALLAANDEATRRRRALSFRPDASPEETGELKLRLEQQAGERIALQDGVVLLAGRVLALIESTRHSAPGGEEARLADLQGRLDRLAADLPAVFERRRKPAVRMQEVGRPRPERPLTGE